MSLDAPRLVFSIDVYLDECERVGADRAVVRDTAARTIKHLRGSAVQRSQTELGQELENRWYNSLKKGPPDWDVYDTDYYLAELWACWIVYSRTYLRAIQKPDEVLGMAVVDHVGEISSVLDLGCGTGLTTAMLTQLFPGARVVGTNLDGTRQMEMARRMGKLYGFEVLPEADGPADIIFASEYFEHVTVPVHHLHEVLQVTNARACLIANTFRTKAVGHFPCYSVRGDWLNGNRTTRAFGQAMRDSSFEKVETGFWNGRPTYWRRRD